MWLCESGLAAGDWPMCETSVTEPPPPPPLPDFCPQPNPQAMLSTFFAKHDPGPGSLLNLGQP